MWVLKGFGVVALPSENEACCVVDIDVDVVAEPGNARAGDLPSF